MALTVAPLTATVMGAVPEHYAGTASGINNAASRVAGLLAIAMFGLLMLAVFSGALRSGLVDAGLPAQVEAAVYERRGDLTGLEPPPDLTDVQQRAVREVVSSAYLSGFRVVVAVSAGLAVLGAGVAWGMVAGKEIKREG